MPLSANKGSVSVHKVSLSVLNNLMSFHNGLLSNHKVSITCRMVSRSFYKVSFSKERSKGFIRCFKDVTECPQSVTVSP